MTVSRAQRARERTQLLIGVALIALLLTIAALVTSYVRGVFARHVELDPATACPLAGPRSVTALVVDRTDPVSEVTALDIRQTLTDELAAVPRYGALYLFTIDPRSGKNPKPLFMRCNPGRGEDADAMAESKKRVDRRFKQAFREPLDAALAAMLANGEAEESPIIETLQGVGVAAFSGEALADAPKRLIVVSDFAQHSERVSFYRDAPENALGSEAAAALAAPLADVDVRLMFVRRDETGETRLAALRDAWLRYLRQSGAGDIQVTKLTGVDQ